MLTKFGSALVDYRMLGCRGQTLKALLETERTRPHNISELPLSLTLGRIAFGYHY